MNRLIFFRVILFVLLLLPYAYAQAAQESNQAPIEVTSERMEALSAPRRVLFSGTVVASQGDIVMYADRMTIYFRENDNDVARIHAEGRVRIVQGERVATGDTGVFHRDEQMVVLSGSPRIIQGRDSVEGDEIIVYLQEERSIVKSREGAPARAIFHPGGATP